VLAEALLNEETYPISAIYLRCKLAHTSIRQHTSACASMRQHTCSCSSKYDSAHVNTHAHTHTHTHTHTQLIKRIQATKLACTSCRRYMRYMRNGDYEICCQQNCRYLALSKRQATIASFICHSLARIRSRMLSVYASIRVLPHALRKSIRSLMHLHTRACHFQEIYIFFFFLFYEERISKKKNYGYA
jgi:hypothetical protein